MARRIFPAAASLYAVMVLHSALTWPQRVPLHFDGELRADSYGSKWAGVTLVAGIGIFMVALFAGCAWLVRRIDLNLVNVRHAEFWKAPENERRLRRRLAEDLYHLGTATLVLLAGVGGFITEATVSGRDELSGWAVALLAVYLAYVAGWTGWLLTGRYRPDRASSAPSGQ